MKRVNHIIITLFFIFALNVTYADIRLPSLVGDHMVLQRDKAIQLWGWADPEERISIQFQHQTYQTTGDKNGKWFVKLNSSEAGGPFKMTLSGNNQIVLNDILIGDVWVCSGQSNMDIPMRRVRDLYEDVIAQSENSQIRYFTVPLQFDFNGPLEEIKPSNWKRTNPENILNFSATAYFFGKNLNEAYDIPIGLIRSSLGGSPAEAWMSEAALKSYPHYLETMKQFRDSVFVQNIVQEDRTRSRAWQQTLRSKDLGYAGETPWYDPDLNVLSWPTMKVPSFWSDEGADDVNGVMWFRKDFKLSDQSAGKPARLDLGRIVDSDSVYINGILVGTTGYQYPPRIYQVPEGLLKSGRNVIVVRVISEIGKGGFIIEKPYQLATEFDTVDLKGLWQYQLGTAMEPLQGPTFVRWQPGGLFNGMIAPLQNLSFKGVIWYQGESNTGKAEEYQTLFPAMIKDWRSHWKQGDFPFIFAQLPNFMESKPQPTESEWADLRYAQSLATALPNTGMSVNIDLGEWNDIHPLNKRDVGKRLALSAMHVAYHDSTVVSSGPVYHSCQVEGGRVTLQFKNLGSGLVVKGDGPLKHFAIKGEDGRFIWAHGEIQGDEVVVWHPSIQKPKAIRYAWADNPDTANLYNQEGLPAAPFQVIIKTQTK